MNSNSSHRINYGIDLGTTNSVISVYKRGRVKVIKNRLQNDTTPSAVGFRKSGSTLVGLNALNGWYYEQLRALKTGGVCANYFVDVKRSMGMDRLYEPSALKGRQVSPEELSAEVLKELRLSVEGEPPTAAVVTIPAAFTVPQQDATLRAARMAGFEECHLLQEPLAAAIANGLKIDETGASAKWLVFDLGGGTFDAALVVLSEGEMSVRGTQGDNHLGGKDLNGAVVDGILVPHVAENMDIGALIPDQDHRQLLRRVLSKWAEHAIIELSRSTTAWVETQLDEIVLPDGSEVDLEIEVTRDELRPFVEPVFQRAIDKAKVLLSRHGLQGRDLDELILVGGPTHSPILREMVTAQLRTPKVIEDPNQAIDPMTCVANGAAMYASTLDRKKAGQSTGDRRPANDDALILDVSYESTTINEIEYVSIKLADSGTLAGYGRLEIEIVGERRTSGKQELVESTLVEVHLERGKANNLDLVVTGESGNRVKTSPSEITIEHGIKVAGAVLAHTLGISVMERTPPGEEVPVVVPLIGAKRDRRLPATGRNRKTLLTRGELRPGEEKDRLAIEIYEIDRDDSSAASNGNDNQSIRSRRTAWSSYVGRFELTGMDVNRVIPEGSALNLEVVTAKSSVMPMEGTISFRDGYGDFPLTWYKHKAENDTTWVRDEVEKAQKLFARLRTSDYADMVQLERHDDGIFEAAQKVFEAEEVSDEDSQAKWTGILRERMREFYRFADGYDWDEVEVQLRSAWADLKRVNVDKGFDELRDEIREIAARMDEVQRRQDPTLGYELLRDIKREHFDLIRCDWSRGYIEWARTNIGTIRWKDPHLAQREVRSGYAALTTNRPCAELYDHAIRIWKVAARNSGPKGPPIPEEAL